MTKVIRRRQIPIVPIAATLLLMGAYSSWALSRTLPDLKPLSSESVITVPTPAAQLAWPNSQAAVGVVGSDALETHGDQKPLPIASVAKVITTLNILQKKPLKPGEKGPLITLTASDVALYTNYTANDGSVLPVHAGEQLTQYQALQAIMLPSANNIADSLAIWAYGSLPTYANAANANLERFAMHKTKVGKDASGLDPTTVSTAEDLVKLGKLALQNPVLAEIANQSSATGLPHADVIKNVNFLLGTNGIIGIKTGNTEQAGGVYLAASRFNVGEKPVTIITAVVGAPSLFAAMKTSLPLIQSAQANFKPVAVIKSGAVVGKYKLPWGGELTAIADQDLSVPAWQGNTITAVVHLDTIPAESRVGQNAGQLTVNKSASAEEKSLSLKLKNAPTKPSAWWRLLHPF